MENRKRRIDRPIGLIVVSVLAVLWGLTGFVSTFVAIKNSPEIPFAYTVIALALPGFLAASAVWALAGQNEGRIALVIVLVLNWAWPMLFAVGALLDSESSNDGDGVVAVVTLTIRALWVIGIACYLLSKRVSEYYHQNDGKQSV